MVNFNWQVFGGKSAPFPTVRVVRVVRPVATVRVWVEPDPDPTRQFAPFANTTQYTGSNSNGSKFQVRFQF